MAVTVRGWIQGARAGQSYTVGPWPAGTVPGDLCLVHCGGDYAISGPQTSGWAPTGHEAHWKILTATDLASQLVIDGSHFKLVVFAGAKGVGRTASTNGVQAVVGSYVWVESSRTQQPIALGPGIQGVEWQDLNLVWQAQYAIAAPTSGTGSTFVKLAQAQPQATHNAYEIMPAAVPAPPLLSSPDSGATVNQAAAITFSWVHNSAFAQIGYRLRLTNGATVRWVTAAGALATTETSVASASQTASAAASALTSGGAYTWAVATQDANGWSSYSAERAFSPIAPPTVTSVTVSAPAGDLSPTVSWAATAGYGVIEAHQVWITPAASTSPEQGALWTSGVIAGAVSPDSAPSSVAWTNGQSLKAWVRATQTGGVYATLASAAFAVSWTAPAIPTVTVHVDGPWPEVTVSGVASGRTVVVEQRLDGVTWTPLTTRVAAGSSIVGIASPLAATGSLVAFRARQATTVDGVQMWSNWSSTVTTTDYPQGCWLVDDSDRSRWLRVTMISDTGRGVVEAVSVTYGLGATSPTMHRTPAAGERGDLVLHTYTTAERLALLAWLRDVETYWIIWPPDRGEPQRAIRAATATPRSWERLAQWAGLSRYDVPLSWVEV